MLSVDWRRIWKECRYSNAAGEKIARGVEIGITNASQSLGSEINIGLQEAGKSVGSGIERGGDKLHEVSETSDELNLHVFSYITDSSWFYEE